MGGGGDDGRRAAHGAQDGRDGRRLAVVADSDPRLQGDIVGRLTRWQPVGDGGAQADSGQK